MTATNIPKYLVRTGAVYLAAAIFFMGVPLEVFAAPMVDIKANGSDGPVTITAGESFSYSWTTNAATACQLTDPDGNESGQDLSGTGGPIPADHPWYPSIGNPSTLTLDCTDGINSVSDSVVIQLAEDEEPEPAPTPETIVVDIKANGSDGPVTITQGDSWVYSWTSENATACQLTAPGGESGHDLDGAGGPIPPNHPWYPTIGNPTTLTLDCTDGVNSVSDSVVIQLAQGATMPTVDIKANGSDGPVTITQGDSWVYSWTSENATACQLTAPGGESGHDLDGAGGPIPPNHPWYPTIGNPTTLTLDCTDGVNSVSDSVVIHVVAPSGPGPSPVCPLPTITSALTGSVTINNSFSYVITSTTSGSATTTRYSVSGLPGGLSFSTTTATISGTPVNTGTSNITITATNDCGSDTETLVLTVNPASSGGGGGGGGRSRNRGSVNPGEVLGAATVTDFCPYITSYMRIGANNDTMQVIRLQAYLKAFEGYDYVQITGTFDAATDQAVRAFQLRYKSEVLTPWGINQPTGYVYKTTLSKINNIVCGSPMPVVQTPAKVVKKPAVLGKESGGYRKEGRKEGAGTSTVSSLPLIGNDVDQEVSKGQKDTHNDGDYPKSLGAALLSWPDTGADMMKCIYELLLVLIVLYILGSVLESVLYKDIPENVSKRFKAKWTTITAGIAVAWAGAYFLQEWCLLMPLLIAFVASLIWLLTRNNSAKSLYVAGSSRARSMFKSEDKGTTNQTVMVTEKK